MDQSGALTRRDVGLGAFLGRHGRTLSRTGVRDERKIRTRAVFLNRWLYLEQNCERFSEVCQGESEKKSAVAPSLLP
jgi:hypothetical protein